MTVCQNQRETRGCRDNTMIMRSIFDDILEQGREMCATFIDYSAAFDSVSHKYIDVTLQQAGFAHVGQVLIARDSPAVHTPNFAAIKVCN